MGSHCCLPLGRREVRDVATQCGGNDQGTQTWGPPNTIFDWEDGIGEDGMPPPPPGPPPWGGVACIWSGPIGWFNEARQHVHVALWTYDRFTGNNTEAYSTGNVNTCDIWGGVERCPNIIWVKYVNVFLNMGPPCNCARHIATITT
jgi:hypothetical protein